MEIRAFDEAGPFARAAGAYLDLDPFSSSVIAVHVAGVLSGVRQQGPQDRYWTLVVAGRVVGIAMCTPPYHLFLARMPVEAAASLAASLAEGGWSLPGVNGEAQTVAAFVAAWQARTGQGSSVAVSMRMYRLAELIVPVSVPGRARAAEPDDIDLVGGWLHAFHDEATPHAPVGNWATLAEERIKPGRLCVWEDNGSPVSMAAFSEAVAGVSRVGPVYTPPPHRKRGYGAGVTAEATAAAISGGAREVVLYTDLSNPTSNAIYQAIGYRADHDAEERAFA
jgi:predicted GNAT family acetyltransferase